MRPWWLLKLVTANFISIYWSNLFSFLLDLQRSIVLSLTSFIDFVILMRLVRSTEVSISTSPSILYVEAILFCSAGIPTDFHSITVWFDDLDVYAFVQSLAFTSVAVLYVIVGLCSMRRTAMIVSRLILNFYNGLCTGITALGRGFDAHCLGGQ